MHRARAGFTLIELLVASGVFLIGFVAVFGLFLAGVRFRKLADDTARASLAASSLIDEIRIDAGRESGGAGPPSVPVAYAGDGFATANRDATDGVPIGATSAPTDFHLYRYPAEPGVWYRVATCTDFRGGNAATTSALRFKLFVLPWSSAEDASSFSLADVVKRLRLTTTTAETTEADLVRRGLGFVYEGTIIRNPSWRP